MNPRLVYRFGFDNEDTNLVVCVVTDFAGCSLTRRSTSGGMMFLGSHLLRHWSTTQATIALSSGEAELVGIVKGASHGLGLQSLAMDLGWALTLEIKSDATAAIGICRRRGLGKVRHISVADLWVQERLKSNDVKLTKILGAENPADMMTNFLPRPSLHKMIQLSGLEWEIGRAESAPTLTHAVMLTPLLRAWHWL